MIAIAGAGPSGLYLASKLRSDADVVVLEEDDGLGKPLHCTGLVNHDNMNLLNINPPVVNRYRYVRIVDLRGKGPLFDLRRKQIAMLHRPGLEEYLSSTMGDAELHLRSRVIDVRRGFVTKHGQVEADILVIAEGARGGLAKRVINWRPHYLVGLQADVKLMRGRLVPDTEDEIVVIFDRRLSNNFFTWIVPKGGGEFRVGLSDNRPVGPMLSKILKMLGGELGAVFGGKVIIGGTPELVAVRNVALVGDSAGYVKPITGGGIVMGMVSSLALSEAILLSIRKGYSVKESLKLYNEIHRRIHLGYLRRLTAISLILHQSLRDSLRSGLERLHGVRIEVEDYDDHVEALIKLILSRPFIIAQLIPLIIKDLLTSLSLLDPSSR